MTTDLRSTLRSLHDHARAAAPDLPVRPVVTRARHRRTIVRAGYGAVGAGAAAALSLGGMAVTGHLGRPAPVVTIPSPSPTSERPSPTPTRTPTPTATTATTSAPPAATAVAAEPLVTDYTSAYCGTSEASLDLALPTMEGDAEATVAGPASVAPGKPWTATVTVPTSADADRTHVEVVGAIALRDGAVYGYTDLARAAVETTGPMPEVSVETSLSLRSCIGDGTAPLGGGTYGLRVLVERFPAGASEGTDEAEWESYPLVLDAGPVRFTGPGVAVPTAPTGTAPFSVEPRVRNRGSFGPTCNAPLGAWPAASTYPWALRLASAVRLENGEVSVTVSVLNTGRDTGETVFPDYPRVVLVRDGIVYGDLDPARIATASTEDPDPSVTRWPSGTAVPLTVTSDEGMCAPNQAWARGTFTPWPTGDYQVYASWLSPTGETVTGGPWAVTLP